MFTQEKKLNILKCPGCEKRCELGGTRSQDCFGYFPTIAGDLIWQYMDKNGNQITVCLQPSKEEAACLARKIAKVCDNYNQKTR